MKKKDENENRNLMLFTEEDALAVLKYGGENLLLEMGRK
jgi:hypothetical protein